MRLLLDVCCGPCSTHVIDVLREDYDVTMFFANSNISPHDEFSKRLIHAKKVSDSTGIPLIKDTYDHKLWLASIKGMESEPEHGRRCELCFRFRLNRTAEYAKKHNYDIFTTTLTVSPHKDSGIINQIGTEISQAVGICFLESDFKKNSGYQKSIIRSKELDLYRQKYCGCEFSIDR